MPLPSNPDMVWPPTELERILPPMAQWSAWWANDLGQLQAVYGGGALTSDRTGFYASDGGGVKVHSIGPVRWFVGEAGIGPSRNTKLPVPIGAEICQASADLLFSDPVTITVGDPVETVDGDGKVTNSTPNPTQARLDDLLDENFHAILAEAAEAGAALGGAYLRVTFDPTNRPEKPFTTVVDADMAWPEFDIGGQLLAVTFWTVIGRDGKAVYRHLERHELDSNRNGLILHGLYLGEEDKLGYRVPLTARTETAALALHTDANLEGTINTGTPGLAVQYIPNQTPNRIWRKDPVGRNLGRSDLDGVEHLMDQLAETMSDWMRARRAARARVMVAKDLVKSAGPGKTGAVNLDQEVFVETSMSKASGTQTPNMADVMHVLQPDYNPDGYQKTASALVEQILQMAGYSMQTFGVVPDGGAGDRTATEIESKERRSLMTRGRKIRPWMVGLREHIRKLLAVDNTYFGQKNDLAAPVTIEFPDGVQESQLKLAQTVAALYTAESASLTQRVTMLHPDWTTDQIDEEVQEIRDEFAPAPMVDPTFPAFPDPTLTDPTSGDTAPVV